MRGPTILLVTSLLLASCGGPKGQRISAEDYLAMERSAEPTHEADDATGFDAAGADEAMGSGAGGVPSSMSSGVQSQATVGGLQRDLADVQQRLRALALERELSADDDRLALDRAERSLRHAREDLAHFEHVELQRSLDEDAVLLAEADDALVELREELSQLQALYGAPQPEGIEAELLERLRRRVERAELRRELAAGRSRDLRERELPRRLEQLRAAVTEGEHALSSLARRSEARAQAGVLELGRLAEDERRLQAVLASRLGGASGP